MLFKLKHIVVYTLLAILCSSFIQKDDTFPVPTGISNMLFYVQRSINKNTIIYELNVNAKDELNEDEPIKIYWINYSGKSDKESLNYIQRKYAYGIESKLIDADKKTFSFNFVSYKKKQLFLIKSPVDKKYKVFSYFNNKFVIVNHIYIHIEGGAFWTPKIKYIDVSVKDPAKNEEYVERVIP